MPARSKLPVNLARLAPLLLLAACFPGAMPPQVPTRGTLGLDALPAMPSSSDGPPRVIFASPRGETTQVSEVSLLFSKPMRALGEAAVPPVTLRPAVKGAFHWVGSAGLRFDAAEPLAPATAYRVEIPAGVRALDGSALAEPFAFDFTTPRAKLVDTYPEAGARSVFRESGIQLTFASPVAHAEILRAVRLRAGAKGEVVPFTVRRAPGPKVEAVSFTARPDEGERVELVPTRGLPFGERVTVHVDASLRAAGGELPAGKDHDFAFEVEGPPRLEAIRCQPHPQDPAACDPDDPRLTVELTSAVSRAALLRALVFEPPVKVDLTDPGQDYNVSTQAFTGAFQPGVTYRVRLAPSRALADDEGHPVIAGEPRPLRFAHRAPRLDLGLRGTYWSARDRHELQALATNAGGALIVARPALPDALATLAAPPAPANGQRFALAPGALDATASVPVRLDDLFPGARGPIDLALRDEKGADTVRRVQITDLGVTARLGHDGAAALVTGLRDGLPLPGAEVEVWRVAPRAPAERLGVTRSDAQGAAFVPFTAAIGEEDDVAVVARSGADWTYARLPRLRAPRTVGAMYTERRLYRPGETVKVSGVLRDPTAAGLVTPRARAVKLVVTGPDSQARPPIAATLSDFGTFTVDVPVPRDAPLGGYHVAVDGPRHDLLTSFRVEEYRPTEIAVEASVDRAEHVRGETLRCDVRGRYLHGGPMAGGHVAIVVQRSESSVNLPGFGGFATEDGDLRGPGTVLVQRARVPFDASGAAALSVPLALPGQVGAEAVRCAVEARDLNHQALAAHAAAIVHPAELYLAVERLRDVAPGDRVAPAIFAVTPSGERRVARVHVEVAERAEWRASAEKPLTSCDVTTGPTAVSCPFTAPARSPYVVVRATATDARGNAVRSASVMSVQKPAPPRLPVPPDRPQPHLTVEGPREHKVGDTGHVVITSPFQAPATALVTVGREGILWRRVVPVSSAPVRVEFPITEAMIPNADVSVALVSGDRVEHGRRSIDVDAAPRDLSLTLDAGDAAHAPGDLVSVSVQVKDARGKPTRAEITLWGADEATLSLIGYRIPIVGWGIHSGRPDLTTGFDSRDDLVRLGVFRDPHPEEGGVRMGATTVTRDRTDFPQTAFFFAHLVTDDQGRLTQRVKLPDGLTTYRVMAVAVAADDRSGQTEAHVTTSLPLMARASLPRVVRAGDRFQAAVIVESREADGDAALTVQAEGLTLVSPPRLTLPVRKGVPARALVELRADRAGPARFTAQAKLGKHADAMSLTREIVPPLVPESAALDGETTSAAAEALGDLSAIRPDFGGLTIDLAASPLAGLADGVEQLVDYPYGCTEQTVSRLVPLLALRELAVSLGVTLPAEAGPEVTKAVTRLLSHQRPDGGFGFWRESAASDPWLTAWSLWGLGEARRRGLPVPAAAEARARAFLAAALSTDPAAPPARLAVGAFHADLLALDGKPDRALAARLLAAREALPPFARALLLHALAKDEPARARELLPELEALVRLDGGAARVATADHHARLLDTDTRTTALLLRGLVALEPGHRLVPLLARGLLESRRGGRFRTTHDAAWALIALDDLRRARPVPDRGVTARVFLGDVLLGEPELHGAAGAHLAVPASTLIGAAGRPLAFTANGPLYYRARLRYARRELPVVPVESGMFLRRAARLLDPEEGVSSDGSYRAGEMVQVDLDLATASPRSGVVIESPLPAGFEPADADLKLGGAWLRGIEKTAPATRRELREDRVLYFVDELPAGVIHLRYVARAVTAGTFVLPPARAEEMYAPETFARTAAEMVTVLAR